MRNRHCHEPIGADSVRPASDFSYNRRLAGMTTASVCVLLQHLPAGVSSLSIVRPSGGHVKSLLDPTFKYVPSAETDIRKTFARIRREARRSSPSFSPIQKRAGKFELLFGDKKRAL
jgi:hypothetical protein